MNHENINKAFDRINQRGGTYNLIKKDKMPGNLFHSPVVIRNAPDNTNMFIEFDYEEDAFEEFKKSALSPPNGSKLPFYAGRIKDAQIKAKFFAGQQILGYTMCARMSTESNIEKIIDCLTPIITHVKLDILEKLNATEKDQFIGTHFLRFEKNKEGNYLTELCHSAGYRIAVTSCCAIKPPDVIDAKTFDKKLAMTWNIGI